MKTIFDHLERVKAQPHHIRKQVAFATAATTTMLIALVWFVGSLATGAFSIKNENSFATGVPGASVTTVTNQNLAGAGAAAVVPDADAPAHIEIIDAASAASAKKRAEQTTIPF